MFSTWNRLASTMKLKSCALKHFASIAALLVVPLVSSAEPTNSCPEVPHTLYSKRAVSLGIGLEGLKSPDGKKLLSIRTVEDKKDADNSHLSFTVSVAGKKFSTMLLGFDTEVVWAQDSSAFAVTVTEGGGGIGNRAYVFYVGENGLKKVDVSRIVERAFGKPVKCDVQVPPNTGFVDWVGGSDRILVAAEVVPVSICQCNGMFKVYELSMPDARISRTYSQIEAKQKFSNLLGCELHDADDKCVEQLRK